MNFICIFCVHTWNASVFLCLFTLQWNICSNIAKQTKMLHLLNNKKKYPFWINSRTNWPRIWVVIWVPHKITVINSRLKPIYILFTVPTYESSAYLSNPIKITPEAKITWLSFHIKLKEKERHTNKLQQMTNRRCRITVIYVVATHRPEEHDNKLLYVIPTYNVHLFAIWIIIIMIKKIKEGEKYCVMNMNNMFQVLHASTWVRFESSIECIKCNIILSSCC